MTKQYWISPAPTECDLCSNAIDKVFYDARIPGIYSWANVCHECFIRMGGILGVGCGQRYEKQSDGKYVCTEGGRSNKRKDSSTHGEDNTTDG